MTEEPQDAQHTNAYRLGEQIYSNPLSSQPEVDGFRLEGSAEISFHNRRMRMSNVLDPAEGQQANFVFWCPDDFPADIAISWDVWPLREPGLCMLFFAAIGRIGEDLFDPALSERNGVYRQYNRGDISINGLQVLSWRDNGKRYGPLLAGGKIGFRQMAPLVAEYANLEVRTAEPA